MRLPVANLRLQGWQVGGIDVRWIRDDQVPRAVRKPLKEVVAAEVDGETGTGNVFGSERKRVC